MMPNEDSPRGDWAHWYVRVHGLALVPIDPGQKAPKGTGWNKPGGYITDADAAEAFWTKHPKHNMGVVLGPSRVCSLDVDHVEYSRQVLRDVLDVDLDKLAAENPTLVGNPARFRIMFRMPEGADYSRHSLSWPNPDDPDGAKHRLATAALKRARDVGDREQIEAMQAQQKRFSPVTVFELRAGAVQDVLPPSIHPETGKPYTWRNPPTDGLPELARDLVIIWTQWDIFKRSALEACPWAPVANKPPAKVKKSSPPRLPAGDHPTVIDSFNQATDVESLLQRHGYVKRGRKWLAPQSSTGMPGVTVVTEPEARVYSHHGSDPLANGHMNDAFDVFCILEHRGDTSAAIKAAARVLGMEYKRTEVRVQQDGPVPPAVPIEAYEGDAYPTTSLAAAIDGVSAAGRKPKVGGREGDGDWTALLRRTEGGGLQPQLMNAYLILKHAPEWEGVLAYNQFAERIEKLKAPPVSDGEAGAWVDVDASKALVWLQMVWGLGVRSSAIVDEAARMVAWDNRYHPVRQWLDALPAWDGVERLGRVMMDVFGADDNDYTRHIGKSLLVSAVARVLKPGCKVDEMVVLEGAQGLGKSTCIAELFGPAWYLETSEAPTTKDFYVVMQGNWVVEIGEMQSFSRADINQVKMAITRRDDKYRAPYDRHGSSHPRQCIFIGTTNADTYLSDPTGARRFLPVLCRQADVSQVRFIRLELWAEALALFRQGFRWWDYPKEMASAEQDARYVEDAWEEAIASYLEGKAPAARYPEGMDGPINEVTIMHLLQHALQMDIAKMNKPEQRRVADILRRMGWERGKQQRVPGNGMRIRPYLRPVAPSAQLAA